MGELKNICIKCRYISPGNEKICPICGGDLKGYVLNREVAENESRIPDRSHSQSTERKRYIVITPPERRDVVPWAIEPALGFVIAAVGTAFLPLLGILITFLVTRHRPKEDRTTVIAARIATIVVTITQIAFYGYLTYVMFQDGVFN